MDLATVSQIARRTQAIGTCRRARCAHLCLLEAGFSYAAVGHAWNAIDSYVYGFTLQELNFPFEPEEYADVAKSFLPLIPADKFPYLNGLSQEVIAGHQDDPHDLRFGLDLILDGLESVREKA